MLLAFCFLVSWAGKGHLPSKALSWSRGVFLRFFPWVIISNSHSSLKASVCCTFSYKLAYISSISFKPRFFWVLIILIISVFLFHIFEIYLRLATCLISYFALCNFAMHCTFHSYSLLNFSILYIFPLPPWHTNISEINRGFFIFSMNIHHSISPQVLAEFRHLLLTLILHNLFSFS